jgi:hypothetical protein
MHTMAALLLLCCATASTAAAADDALANALSSVVFLNEGTVRSTDSFSRLTQCNGFTECYTTWECGAVRDNLYNTTIEAKPTPPAIGMRSAVPLGGLGTGTFELRADGSFADWQVENQGPALATDKAQNSKLPTLDGALLGLRLGDSFVTTLQTHPVAATGEPALPAAEALSYSGSYPFSRHTLNDSRMPRGVSAQLYSFSAVKLHDENASALPAVAFTVVLENAGSEPLNASFLLTLPLAATPRTSRRGSTAAGVIKTIGGGASAGSCIRACNAEPACTHWDLDLTPSPGVPAVPATNATVMKDHDCPGSDLWTSATRLHGYTDITQVR